MGNFKLYYLPINAFCKKIESSGKLFPKIDSSDAYLQILGDENISKLLTIDTHKGLYKFERFTFAVKVAPAIFQQIMETMLSGLDYVVAYVDF